MQVSRNVDDIDQRTAATRRGASIGSRGTPSVQNTRTAFNPDEYMESKIKDKYGDLTVSGEHVLIDELPTGSIENTASRQLVAPSVYAELASTETLIE